jgi:thioredoxin-related protein
MKTNTRLMTIWLLLLVPLFASAQNIKSFNYLDKDNQVAKVPFQSGKNHLLVLWSAQSQTCKTALLKIKTVFQRIKAEGFNVVMVEVTGSGISSYNWYRKARLPYYYLLSPGGDEGIAKRYQQYSKPVFLLADKLGRIHLKFSGYSIGDEYRLLELCENFSRQTSY